jgi:NADPH:quinone reductase-like Zn-dependent oxidoreductase
VEITQPERWIDLTFGMTDGWWSFTDHDLRPSHALLSTEQWTALLGEFGSVSAICPRNAAWNSVFLVQKPSASSPDLTGEWLLVADRQGVAAELAQRLRDAGATPVLVHPGDPWPAERRWRGVIQLAALDLPASLAGPEGLTLARETACHTTLALVQYLTAGEPAPLWLVTRGAQYLDAVPSTPNPAQAMVWGMGRTIQQEHPELGCRCFDLDSADRSGEALWEALQTPNLGDQIVARGPLRAAPRIVPRTAPPSEAAPQRLAIPRRGRIDDLVIELATRRVSGPGQVEIEVAASGLNFRDVLNVLDLYPGDPGPLGGECTGTVVALGAGVTDFKVGDPVVAFASGCHDGYVVADRRLVAHRPPELSWQAAATLPISFVTAAFTLEELGRIRQGDRVLIHAGTGGVGLAAVQLAQRAGAEVFATAGTEEKRAYLRSLGVPHVYSSRTLEFRERILEDTGGRGVDVVLNSLADEFVEASFAVTAAGGRFLEIGKRGIWTAEQVEALGRGIEYHVVDWGEVAAADPDRIGQLLRSLMEAAEAGTIKPLPVRTFPIADAPAAFRYMAQARHLGKIVLTQPAACPRITADATYLIAGGLGGLGLRTAQWLVERGARHLALIGRHAPNEETARELDRLRALGVEVATLEADVGRRTELEAALERLASMPPLRGVINAAGALADGTLRRQSWPEFASMLGPKVDGSWHLHELTRHQSLDFFVMYSSLASMLGAPGQANHAAANAFEDALAAARRADGRPAISINWGAWSELGSATDDELRRRQASQGLGALTPEEGITLLERILELDPVQIAAARIDWRTLAGQGSIAAAPLEHLLGTDRGAPVEEPVAAKGLTRLLAEAPPAKRTEMLERHLEAMARKVLGFPAGRRIDPLRPLQELGLDSLMAVEFRNALASAVERPLAATLLFNYPTLDDIASFLARDVFGWTAAPAPVQSEPRGELLDQLENLSDDEIDRLFAQQFEDGRP